MSEAKKSACISKICEELCNDDEGILIFQDANQSRYRCVKSNDKMLNKMNFVTKELIENVNNTTSATTSKTIPTRNKPKSR